MADMNQMQIDGDEAKGQHGDEYEEIREQVSDAYCVRLRTGRGCGEPGTSFLIDSHGTNTQPP